MGNTFIGTKIFWNDAFKQVFEKYLFDLSTYEFLCKILGIDLNIKQIESSKLINIHKSP